MFVSNETFWFPVLQMTLLVLVLYFLVRGIVGFIRQGCRYLLSTWTLLGVCKLTLAATVCGLQLSRGTAAGQQWASYVKQRDAFTDFSAVGRETQTYSVMSAVLLFVLVLKVRHFCLVSFCLAPPA